MTAADVILALCVGIVLMVHFDYRTRTNNRLEYLKRCVDDLVRKVDPTPPPPPLPPRPPAWRNTGYPHPWDDQ